VEGKVLKGCLRWCEDDSKSSNCPIFDVRCSIFDIRRPIFDFNIRCLPLKLVSDLD
jgi:hypothetical protein